MTTHDQNLLFPEAGTSGTVKEILVTNFRYYKLPIGLLLLICALLRLAGGDPKKIVTSEEFISAFSNEMRIYGVTANVTVIRDDQAQKENARNN